MVITALWPPPSAVIAGKHPANHVRPVPVITRSSRFRAPWAPPAITSSSPAIRPISPPPRFQPGPITVISPISLPESLDVPSPVGITVARPPVSPSVVVTPPRPFSPKPNPPDAPPSDRLLRHRLNTSVLQQLQPDCHPQSLLRVTEITGAMMVITYRIRAGVIHPPLPFLDPPSSAVSSTPETTPPSPLRTTPGGIRLEITLAAMVLRNRPEGEIPVNSSLNPNPQFSPANHPDF